MKAFLRIIGYNNEKKELMRIADILKNPEHYKKLGAKPPKGLLLNGRPGMGKTLMANALIEESGRPAFVCRKDKPNGSFVNHIAETFEQAKQNAPSIVLLDDMDKFANEDEEHRNAEEYVTIQSCIDDVKNLDVFVIATTNDTRTLPDSLIRSGRFDQVIHVYPPKYKDALNIIKHYLKNKKVMSDVEPDYIAKLMCRRSCATIESIINHAANIAAFERCDKIQLSHFVEAAARNVFRYDQFNCCDEKIDLDANNSMLAEIVYHEAGHVLIQELLCPESVTLVAIGENSGFTAVYDGDTEDDVRDIEFSIITSLGGIAAIEQIYGRKGLGCSCDLEDAQRNIIKLLRDYGKYGLNFVSCPVRAYSDDSVADREIAASVILEMNYEKAKKLIAGNRQFLEKLAIELAEKKILTMYDIQRIKSGCKIKIC